MDWFTLLVGLTATASVALHGAIWLAHRVEGPIETRARKLVAPLAIVTLLSLLLTSAGLIVVRPDLPASLAARPFVFLLPALALAGRGDYRRAFLGSATFLAAMVLTAAATIYPNVIVARITERSISASAARAGEYGLSVGLYWWLPGVLLAMSYFAFLYRQLPRAVRDADLDDHPD